MRRRFARWRRRWCVWRNHPDSLLGPIVMYDETPAYWDGEKIVDGQVFALRGYRCAKHDDPPM